MQRVQRHLVMSKILWFVVKKIKSVRQVKVKFYLDRYEI